MVEEIAQESYELNLVLNILDLLNSYVLNPTINAV